MKSFKLLFVLSIIFIIAACSHDKKDELIKTWQVSDIETETDLVDSIKRAMLLSSTMQFTEDGHYTSSGGIGADQGTFTLDKEGKTLSTISTAGRSSDVYTINDLDSDKLVLVRGQTKITLNAVKP
ncbi:MAG: hypothetical protein H7Y07_18780 [Pyrinomonadaceae bacterium]|nr:hypothetical protein [Sphingobacteriaceae bacterium]